MPRHFTAQSPPGCSDLALLLQSLLRDVEHVEINDSTTVAIGYPEFVRYFQEAVPLTRHHFIIGASFTYSWMPTILDFRSHCLDLGVGILERARGDGELSHDDLLELSKIINNSIVGASKLLHFAAPERFAIWDSRVAEYLGATVKYGADGVRQYETYNACCRALASTPKAAHLAVRLGDRMKCSLRPMRALDLLMYYAALSSLTYHPHEVAAQDSAYELASRLKTAPAYPA